MAKDSNTDEEIHAEGKRNFEETWAATFRECEASLEDRFFLNVAGGQYQGDDEETFENRPKPEVNKCKIAQRRIAAESRKNPITADYIAEDGREDSEETASQLDDLYRRDERDCDGQDAYDSAFDDAVGGGKGGYRYRTIHVDEFDPENEHQRIVWDHIPDADVSMHFDINAKKQDKRDAKWGGIITSMSREAYKEEHGEDPASWPSGINIDSGFDWITPDLVYIFEYYRVEMTSRTLRIYETIEGEEVKHFEDDLEKNPDIEERLIATGHTHLTVRDRQIKVRAVHRYIMDGNKLLKKDGRVPGNMIPIVPEYGERVIVNGVERFNGITRTLKDAQRIYNMLIGMLCEIATIGTQEVPIFAPSQMPQKLRDQWAQASDKRFPFLLAEPLKDAEGNIVTAGPMSFTKAPEVPPALAALINVVGLDIKELLGESQNMNELVSNISGKAIELIQQKQDIPNFIFIDNKKKARKRGAEIYLAMAKEIYVEDGRVLRTLGKEGKAGEVTIGRPTLGEDGEVRFEFDLQNANIGVFADVGPSSVSKKAAAASEFMNALSVVPQGTPEFSILLASAMMNMEGEGMQELRPFWRNMLLDLGALEPTKEEKQERDEKAALQAEQTDANEELLLAAAKEATAKADEALAKIGKLEADTLQSLAKTEETKANTAETLSGIDRDDLDQVVRAQEAINQTVTAQP